MRLPRDPRARVLLAIGAALVAFLLVLAAIDKLSPAPRGPRSSSYATSPVGLAGYASVLERSGLRVRRQRRPVGERAPATGETLVVLDPDVIEPNEAKAIGAWVRAGGRLVAGGARDASWLDEVLPEPPVWDVAGAGRARVLVPVAETAGVSTVRTAQGGGWHALGGALPVVGPARAPLVVTARSGRGTVVLLADASPLQNRLLAAADDAALGLGLAGARPVTFLETVHGYSVARGFGGLPARVRWALLGLALAALVALWSAGRRLGPPEDPERPLPPPRSEYVDALAAALVRAAPAEELRAEAARAAPHADTARAGAAPHADTARAGAAPHADAARAAPHDAVARSARAGDGHSGPAAAGRAAPHDTPRPGAARERPDEEARS